MIKLYWNIGSQPARAVKALLEIGKIAHQEIQLNLKDNETRTAQFLKINPFGQIPFIVTEKGQGIAQSNAIMQYLCQKYPERLAAYYGANLKQRAATNTFLSWYQSYFRPCLFSPIKIKVYGTIKQGIPHTKKQLKQSNKAIGQALNYLQNFLKNSTYVTGQKVSIADLLIYFQVTNLIYYQMQQSLNQLQRVSQWYHKISQIPQVKAIQQKWKQTVPTFKQFMNSAKSTQQ